jgi:hypothetical protein
MTRAPRATRSIAAAALALLLVALGYAVASGLDEDDTSPPARTAPATAPRQQPKPPAPRRPAARLVPLTAAGAFDPEGDGHERDEEAPLAVDGKRDTFWRTERYARFFKSGVGLVLDARRPVRLVQVVVHSPTPGVRAEIRLGGSPTGPFTKVSAAKTLSARTSFPVARRTGRYVVIWITSLPPASAGEISEVRARAT